VDALTESVSQWAAERVTQTFDILYGPDVRASGNSWLFLDLSLLDTRTTVVLEIEDSTYNVLILDDASGRPKQLIFNSHCSEGGTIG
jgi:hypothetical protein